MAKLYFYYSAMNAGKSTVLLQSNHNYRERGMDTLLLLPAIDKRFKEGVIASRIGLSAPATVFEVDANLFDLIQNNIDSGHQYACILVDEAQFLTRIQVEQLARVADTLAIPVLAYGIRTDFRAALFEGSQYLLAWADELIELKTICHCGRKATMNMRIDALGQMISEGEQLMIGGNESYVSTCRKHFYLAEPGPLISV